MKNSIYFGDICFCCHGNNSKKCNIRVKKQYLYRTATKTTYYLLIYWFIIEILTTELGLANVTEDQLLAALRVLPAWLAPRDDKYRTLKESSGVLPLRRTSHTLVNSCLTAYTNTRWYLCFLEQQWQDAYEVSEARPTGPPFTSLSTD